MAADITGGGGGDLISGEGKDTLAASVSPSSAASKSTYSLIATLFGAAGALFGGPLGLAIGILGGYFGPMIIGGNIEYYTSFTKDQKLKDAIRNKIRDEQLIRQYENKLLERYLGIRPAIALTPTLRTEMDKTIAGARTAVNTMVVKSKEYAAAEHKRVQAAQDGQPDAFRWSQAAGAATKAAQSAANALAAKRKAVKAIEAKAKAT